MKKLIRVGVTARSAVVPQLAARRVFEFLNAKQALFALILALLFTPAVHAATLTWNCADGYWDVTGCWSPTDLPTSLDDVYLNPVSGGNTLLVIDAITGNAYANTVTVASTTTGAPVTLQQRTIATAVPLPGVAPSPPTSAIAAA